MCSSSTGGPPRARLARWAVAVVGGLLLGVADAGLIGSVGTRSQQPRSPSASEPAGVRDRDHKV